MTTDDLTRMCPPPDGMRWEAGNGGHFLCVSERRDGRQVHIDPTWVANFGLFKVVATGAGLDGHHGVWFRGDADLPAAYRRALQAVGLASPWTSEVPTEAGRYLVARPGKLDVLIYTRSNYRPERPWCSPTSGWCKADIFPDGTLFMPCPTRPKELS